MAVPQEVAERIICPRCGKNVRFDDVRIVCETCGLSSPVIEGVPMMVPDSVEDESSLTAERFGYEWKKFDENYDEYEAQFLDWIYPVQRDFFRDKVVLDAGCGKGKPTVIAESFGAQAVAAVD